MDQKCRGKRNVVRNEKWLRDMYRELRIRALVSTCPDPARIGWKGRGMKSVRAQPYSLAQIDRYSTTPRNGNRVNGNHLDIFLSSPQKNGN